MVGKYVDLTDSYKSLNEALAHGGVANDCRGRDRARRLGEDRTARGSAARSSDADGILVPMGFGPRGTEGKIATVQYARESKVPFLGICFGMQMAVDRVRPPRLWSRGRELERGRIPRRLTR